VDLGLNNKTALVTGASRGLGKAVAAALVAEGAKVAICARDTTRLEAAATEIGAIGIAADLSQAGAVDSAPSPTTPGEKHSRHCGSARSI
jgi:3-oxoacyl-[acyl-carrier protein] reductase